RLLSFETTLIRGNMNQFQPFTSGTPTPMMMPVALKLKQGQVWKHGDEFIRIVHLERLEVGYKVVKNLKTGEGKHEHTSKKDFCRLLKSCTLLQP
ncbi:MAG TPA: hypothetical protein VN625_09085, partial [Desulfuromonadaceae bacterium]|nr:hypothetical protein [Desulfuromonadaceae bacterium]